MTEQVDTNGKDPFNLIDQDIAAENAKATESQSNPESSNTTASNNNQATNQTQATQKWLFDRFVDFLSSLGNNNQQKTNTENNAIAQDNNKTTENKWDEPHDITKQIVKFIAKLTWQPDPETWKQITQAPQTSGNESNATETSETKKIDFDSVMAWVSWFIDKVWQTKVVSSVTWVLDKIENKIEEKTWISLDQAIQKVEKPTQTENTQQTTQPTPTESTQQTTQPTPTENSQTTNTGNTIA